MGAECSLERKGVNGREGRVGSCASGGNFVCQGQLGRLRRLVFGVGVEVVCWDVAVIWLISFGLEMGLDHELG